MKESGELIEWNDDRGFGFVQPQRGPRLFVHISAFEGASRRPQPGDRLLFASGPGRDGRPAVVTARIAGATRPTRTGLSPDRIESIQLARSLRLVAAAILVAALIVLPLPRIALWIYLTMGVVSFLAYWSDKRAAQANRWRIPEATLHGIDTLGGIVGGLLAQVALGHKTAKPNFAFVTYGIVLCHLAALAALVLARNDLPIGWR